MWFTQDDPANNPRILLSVAGHEVAEYVWRIDKQETPNHVTAG